MSGKRPASSAITTSPVLDSGAAHPGFAEPRTKEEWRSYVLTNPPAVPRLPATLVAYRNLDDEQRVALDEQRYDYHSALVLVQTPPMRDLQRQMRTTARMNRCAPAGARRGHVLDGPATLGKSTIVKTFGRDHELELRKHHPERFNEPCRDYIPVVYISIPAAVTPKMLSLQIAEYLALPLRRHATLTDITNAVLKALGVCGTEIVIVDDIHFLDCSQKDGRLVNDHLKYLANHCAATFLYAGVNVANTSLFSEGTNDRGTQTAGRFSLLPIRPFGEAILSGPQKTRAQVEVARRQAVEWASVVRTMEDALSLYRHQPESLTRNHAEYLLRRTGGRISSLSALIRWAAIRSIEDGTEEITLQSLENAPADLTADADFDRLSKAQHGVLTVRRRETAPHRVLRSPKRPPELPTTV